jgi:septal ring factor EnvC (AmiA/AmiB activator)
MNLDKDTLKAQLDRLVQDSIGIKAAVSKFQDDISETRRKIEELTQSFERHQGALNYNGILIESVRKQIGELDKVEPAAPPAVKPGSL